MGPTRVLNDRPMTQHEERIIAAAACRAGGVVCGVDAVRALRR
jgi:hypothetical protein